MTETFEPERILAALNAAGVAYVIVGGIAVAAHGAIRATADVDVVPDPSATNLDSLAAVLNDLGADHALPGESLSLDPPARTGVPSGRERRMTS
jgi:hypothetical protein